MWCIMPPSKCDVRTDHADGMSVYTVYQLSVLKGDAGNPSALYKLASSGLSAHAYRTATGFFTAFACIQPPYYPVSDYALAQTNFLSAPAIANDFRYPYLSFATSPCSDMIKIND